MHPAGGGDPATPEERALLDELIVHALLRLEGQRGQSRDIINKIKTEEDLQGLLDPRLLVVAKKYRNARRCVFACTHSCRHGSVGWPSTLDMPLTAWPCPGPLPCGPALGPALWPCPGPLFSLCALLQCSPTSRVY